MACAGLVGAITHPKRSAGVKDVYLCVHRKPHVHVSVPASSIVPASLITSPSTRFSVTTTTAIFVRNCLSILAEHSVLRSSSLESVKGCFHIS